MWHTHRVQRTRKWGDAHSVEEVERARRDAEALGAGGDQRRYGGLARAQRVDLILLFLSVGANITALANCLAEPYALPC